jgi:hypothetical protein
MICAPARLIEGERFQDDPLRSIQPFAAAASTIAYSPETW